MSRARVEKGVRSTAQECASARIPDLPLFGVPGERARKRDAVVAELVEIPSSRSHALLFLIGWLLEATIRFRVFLVVQNISPRGVAELDRNRQQCHAMSHVKSRLRPFLPFLPSFLLPSLRKKDHESVLLLHRDPGGASVAGVRMIKVSLKRAWAGTKRPHRISIRGKLSSDFAPRDGFMHMLSPQLASPRGTCAFPDALPCREDC